MRRRGYEKKKKNLKNLRWDQGYEHRAHRANCLCRHVWTGGRVKHLSLRCGKESEWSQGSVSELILTNTNQTDYQNQGAGPPGDHKNDPCHRKIAISEGEGRKRCIFIKGELRIGKKNINLVYYYINTGGNWFLCERISLGRKFKFSLYPLALTPMESWVELQHSL